MAEEVGVAFVRLVPSMRGFGPEAQRALNDATQGPADAAGQEAGGRFGGAFKAALAGAGLAAGAVLVGGITEALNQGRIVAKLGAQLGATPAEAKKYGEIAGDLYAGAIVNDFQQGADTIRAVMASGLVPPDATNDQIKSISTNVADLANTFDLDLSTAANAAGSMLKNGLAKNGTEALDLLTAGMTGLGPASEDLVETFGEYGPIFQSAGISGQTAMGLIRQAVQGGWVKDTDKIADAFKEFGLRATEGSKGVTEAFKTLRLDAKQTGDDIAAGGKRGEQAMGLVLDRLRELGPDTQQAKQIVSTLFGGPGEDLGAALFALDVDKAAASMDGAAGSAGKLGDGLRDNAAAKVTAFKNTMQQNLVEFLGNEVIPKLATFFGFVQDNSGLFKAMAVGVLALGTAFTIASIGVWAMNSAMLANPMFWIIAGIAAAVAGLVILIVTYWDEIKAATMAAWSWVVDKVTWAKDGIMSAIGWLGSLPGKIAGWFGAAKDWAVRKLTELVGWVAGFPSRTMRALASLAGNLRERASSAFQSFRNAAVTRAVAFIDWVRGLPGRLTRAVGSLNRLLFSKGQDVIRGLWNGIKSMGSWIYGKAKNFVSGIVDGVKSGFGIFSPSKVMAKEVGRFIPPGIVKGWESNMGDVKAMAARTANAATSALPTAGTASRPSAAAAPTVVLDAHGMPRALVEWLRNAIRTEAGGSAERFFKPAR